MNTQELFKLTECEIKKEIKSGKVLAVATSYEWGQVKQQVCFQVKGEYLGQWVNRTALVGSFNCISENHNTPTSNNNIPTEQSDSAALNKTTQVKTLTNSDTTIQAKNISEIASKS